MRILSAKAVAAKTSLVSRTSDEQLRKAIFPSPSNSAKPVWAVGERCRCLGVCNQTTSEQGVENA